MCSLLLLQCNNITLEDIDYIIITFTLKSIGLFFIVYLKVRLYMLSRYFIKKKKKICLICSVTYSKFQRSNYTSSVYFTYIKKNHRFPEHV